MTDYLILLAVIVGVPAQGLAVKQFQRQGFGNRTLMFTAMISLAALIPFLVASGGRLTLSLDYLPYSVAFAVSYSVSFAFQILALSCGPLSLTMLIQSYSLLLPTFYGILFLDEDAGIFFYIGVALLAICLLLTHGRGEDDGETRIRPRWFVFAWLSFLGNGMCSVIQKMETVALGKTYQNEFMITALLLIFAVFGMVGILRERKQLARFVRRGWYWGTLCGLINGGVNLGVLVLSGRMPASLQFPLVSAGSLLVSLLFSVLLCRERLTRRQCIGVGVGILSVVCLNL